MSRNDPASSFNTRNTILKIIHDVPGHGTPASHSLSLLTHADHGHDNARRVTGQLPAHVLDAGDMRAIPFQGRESELATVAKWLDDGTPAPSVQVITGRAGQGKTRLGMEIAARAHKQGWLAGFLPACDAGLFPASGFKTVWNQPTLVMIDNAATRTPLIRAWLKAVLRQPPGTHPLRFLLFERTGLDSLWLDQIFGVDDADSAPLATALPAMRWPALGPLAGAQAQFAVFASAYRAAGGGTLPADATRQLGPKLKALSVENATVFPALLGLVAAHDGLLEARRLAPSTLLARVAAIQVAGLERQWRSTLSTPEALRPAVPYLAAVDHLCGGLKADMLRPVLQAGASATGYDLQAIRQIGDTALHAFHATLHGGMDATMTGMPGMVREAVGLHLAAALPDGQWTDALDALLAHASVRGRLVTGIAIACQNLGLLPAGTQAHDLLHTGLEHVLRTCCTDPALLLRLALNLPTQPAAIKPVALDVVRTLVSCLRDDASSPPAAMLAWGLAALCRRNAALFHDTAALHCAREAVTIHAALADTDPATFNPALAAGLHTLAGQYNTICDYASGQAAAAQAVALYTELAARSDFYLPQRARSLCRLAMSHNRLEEYRAAEQAVCEAIGIQAQLTGTEETGRSADLAESFLVMATYQDGLEQHAEAVETAMEAVILYTRLAHDDPDTCLPRLARGLHRLSALQGFNAQHADALQSIEESFSIYTTLEERGADDYRPEIGTTLETLSLCQNALKRYEDSLRSIKDAVACYRSLAAEHPEAFRSGLVDLLLRLGRRYSTLSPPRHTESVAATREAVDLLTLMATEGHGYFRTRPAARTLDILQQQLKTNGETQVATSVHTAVIGLLALLTRQDPDTFHPRLLEAVQDLEKIVEHSGRMAELLEALQIMLPVQREIVARNPDAADQREILASVLCAYAIISLQDGRNDAQVRDYYTESLGMLGEFASADPDTFCPPLLDTLTRLSGLHTRPEQQADRIALCRMGVSLLEPLAARDPQAFSRPLVLQMEQLGRVLVDCGQAGDALAVIEQAMAVHTACPDARDYDDAPTPSVPAMLTDLQARAYEALGRDGDALAAIRHVIALHAALVDEGMVFHRLPMARHITRLAACQMRLGARDAALRSCQKSVALFRAILGMPHEDHQEAIADIEADLASALLEQARAQGMFACHAAARESVMEAAMLLRDLTARDPTAHRHALAQALAMLISLPLPATAHDDGGVATMAHIVALYRELDDRHPGLFMPELAQALATSCGGGLRAQPVAWADALDSGTEATALYASLYDTEPDLYRAPLADSQYRLFICHNGLEQIDRAMESLKAALTQYRHLAARRPEEFRAPLARCLLDLARYRVTYKQYEAALQTAHEASALYTDLAQSERGTYQPVLKEIRDLQALITRKLRR
ncbi:hypothetical protein [Komagataeibacter sp. FNDCF1]|uniref:hypothetical protein n=1 Tax=Komagataeibacter sp. FNDCF1 TaxID=2878681 RepID=UPI001E3B0C7A|nr:hypothetical protein [Komagataeibacter sp. FNDCF1]MCE2563510.1 hypothetical protein [Komagataeibacter sp. FNDCF1]